MDELKRISAFFTLILTLAMLPAAILCAQERNQSLRVGEENYLFWLEDAKMGTVLLYSVYEDGSWSEAAPVSDDGTADLSFDVATNGTDAFVVWANVKKVSKSGKKTDAKPAKTDIRVAKITGSSIKRTTLTDNNKCNVLPSIAVDTDGCAIIAWVERKNNDPGAKGKNGICLSLENGTGWTTPVEVVSEKTSPIQSMQVGILDNNFAISYSLEEGDYLCSDDGFTPVKVGGGDAVASNPNLSGKTEGGNRLSHDEPAKENAKNIADGENAKVGFDAVPVVCISNDNKKNGDEKDEGKGSNGFLNSFGGGTIETKEAKTIITIVSDALKPCAAMTSEEGMGYG